MDESNVDKNENDQTASLSSIASNELLTTIYDITCTIFRHLPMRSIDSCSMVCQSWAQQARLTKIHRHTIHALTYPSNPFCSTDKQ